LKVNTQQNNVLCVIITFEIVAIFTSCRTFVKRWQNCSFLF